MIDEKIKRIDEELQFLKDRVEFGGTEGRNLCKSLESVLRDLKLFDQKRLRAEQMERDVNLRLEAIAISLEKITKILKNNGLV